MNSKMEWNCRLALQPGRWPHRIWVSAEVQGEGTPLPLRCRSIDISPNPTPMLSPAFTLNPGDAGAAVPSICSIPEEGTTAASISFAGDT